MSFATRTTVPVEQSIAELTETLRHVRASDVVAGWSAGGAILAFRLNGRAVRINVPMPPESAFELTDGGRRRSPLQAERAREQVQRQRWRALSLIVRAKLEAIELGAATLEEEFLSGLVLPGGQTVGQQIGAGLMHALSSGTELPPLLPEGAR